FEQAAGRADIDTTVSRQPQARDNDLAHTRDFSGIVHPEVHALSPDTDNFLPSFAVKDAAAGRGPPEVRGAPQLRKSRIENLEKALLSQCRTVLRWVVIDHENPRTAIPTKVVAVPHQDALGR